MALLSCSECSGTVSTKAASCPHCGAPVADKMGTGLLVAFQPVEAEHTSLITAAAIKGEAQADSAKAEPVALQRKNAKEPSDVLSAHQSGDTEGGTPKHTCPKCTSITIGSSKICEFCGFRFGTPYSKIAPVKAAPVKASKPIPSGLIFGVVVGFAVAGKSEANRNLGLSVSGVCFLLIIVSFLNRIWRWAGSKSRVTKYATYVLVVCFWIFLIVLTTLVVGMRDDIAPHLPRPEKSEVRPAAPTPQRIPPIVELQPRWRFLRTPAPIVELQPRWQFLRTPAPILAPPPPRTPYPQP